MQGSLDNPPIVIEASRAKPAIGFLASAFFFAVSLSYWRGDLSAWKTFCAVLCLGSFGLFAIVCAVAIICPGRMTLSQQGLLIQIRWRSWRKTWKELGSFHVVTQYYRFIPVGRYVACTSSRFGGMPGVWRMSAQDLADLLNAARDRWSAEASEPGSPPRR